MSTFTVQSITNPVYMNAEGTGIDVQVKFAELNESILFYATAWDPEPHGQQIFNDLKAGKYGAIAPYVFDANQAAQSIRSQRDMLLIPTDWTQGSDIPSGTKNKWEPYRQALRDVPQQSTFPTSVVWPTPPD
jgi:hypothetical protein